MNKFTHAKCLSIHVPIEKVAELNKYFHSDLFSHAADQLTLIEQSFTLIILQCKWGVGIEGVHYSALKSKETRNESRVITEDSSKR